jgi:hypothetical protein
MFHLLTIYPVQSCNLRCPQCPASIGQVPVDHPWNKLNNAMLFPWLKEYFPYYKTFIELRGGEPSLYSEIVELMKWLGTEGYHGSVKTNGILPIPKTDGFVRLAAWHRDVAYPPKYYDVILILANPNQDWQAKVRYCQENNIPYRLGNYEIYHGPDKGKIYSYTDGLQDLKLPTNSESVSNSVSFFSTWTLVFSNADINSCMNYLKYEVLGDDKLHPDDKGAKVWKMSPPHFKAPCGHCSNVVAQELGIHREWRDFLKSRYKAVRQGREFNETFKNFYPLI